MKVEGSKCDTRFLILRSLSPNLAIKLSFGPIRSGFCDYPNENIPRTEIERYDGITASILFENSYEIDELITALKQFKFDVTVGTYGKFRLEKTYETD